MSGTRRRILIDRSIDVFPKPFEGSLWRGGKDRKNSVGGNENPLPNRNQLADRHTMASDDEGLDLVESSHDSTTFIAELSLRDQAAHCRRL